jgi:hypothetical protein
MFCKREMQAVHIMQPVLVQTALNVHIGHFFHTKMQSIAFARLITKQLITDTAKKLERKYHIMTRF